MAGALFADRDGTIIVDLVYPKDPSRVTLVPGAAEALRALRARGLRVVVVSNQSGVARGLLTERDVWRVHDRMVSLLEAEGAGVDAAYYCVHGPDDGCACRKPRPEMILRGARDLDLDLDRSFLVGDKPSDVAAGLAAGCTSMFMGPVATGPQAAPNPGPAAPGRASGHRIVHTWSDVVATIRELWSGAW